MAVQRRLAAILAADVAGYSRLMGKDEAGTRGRFNGLLDQAVRPAIAENRGRLVKTMGDGFLVEFASVLDAVQCATQIQAGAAAAENVEAEDARMRFRIGIHLGDVIVEDEDIHGDGVNIAARLEGLAEPGGILVSDMVHSSVRGKLALDFTDKGEQSLKNIAEPVRVYAVAKAAAMETAGAALSLPEKPSIAVLPFANMSGDPEQEYFSDGISEDLITALSRIRQFCVVARNSTFAYKGRSPDVRAVAKELAARYVIEGSVRKAGHRIRLTAQLIDGTTGQHLWAERYDRDLDDIFVLQDELTIAIVGAVEPAMDRAEQDRAKRKPPDSLDAWDCYQRGMSHLYRRTDADMREARKYFEKAIAIDAAFAPAYSGRARTYFFDALFGFSGSGRDEALQAALRAVELDFEDAGAHLALGLIHYIGRNFELALPELETALHFNPSFANAHHIFGTLLAHSGRPEPALPHLQAAIRLSPNDGEIAAFHARVAMALLYLKHHEDAVEWARKAVRLPAIQWPGHCFLVASLAHLGRTSEAARALEVLSSFRPGISCSFVREHLPTINSDDMNHLLDGLRKAGLSEQ